MIQCLRLILFVAIYNKRAGSLRHTLVPSAPEVVYGRPFKLGCLTNEDDGHRIALFYRSKSEENAGVPIAKGTFNIESKHCMSVITTPTEAYDVTCSANGHQIFLELPKENGNQHDTWWRCKTSNHEVTDFKPFHIYLIVPVQEVFLLVDGQSVTSLENSTHRFMNNDNGNSLELTCITNELRPASNITWFHNGKRVTILEARDVILYGEGEKSITRSKIIFPSDTISAGDTFYCEAQNYKKETVKSKVFEIRFAMLGDNPVNVSPDDRNRRSKVTGKSSSAPLWIPIVCSLAAVLLLTQCFVIWCVCRRKLAAKRNRREPAVLPRLSHPVDPSCVSNHLYDSISGVSRPRVKSDTSYLDMEDCKTRKDCASYVQPLAAEEVNDLKSYSNDTDKGRKDSETSVGYLMAPVMDTNNTQGLRNDNEHDNKEDTRPVSAGYLSPLQIHHSPTRKNANTNFLQVPKRR